MIESACVGVQGMSALILAAGAAGGAATWLLFTSKGGIVDRWNNRRRTPRALRRVGIRSYLGVKATDLSRRGNIIEDVWPSSVPRREAYPTGAAVTD